MAYERDEGRERLQRFVTALRDRPSFLVDHLEEIEGVEDVLRKHTLNKEKNLSSVFTPDENAQGMVHASATPRPRATAVQMGDDKTVERGEGHMTNPDGNPNFVVTAGKDTKRKSKTEQPAPEAAPSEGATV